MAWSDNISTSTWTFLKTEKWNSSQILSTCVSLTIQTRSVRFKPFIIKALWNEHLYYFRKANFNLFCFICIYLSLHFLQILQFLYILHLVPLTNNRYINHCHCFSTVIKYKWRLLDLEQLQILLSYSFSPTRKCQLTIPLNRA